MSGGILPSAGSTMSEVWRNVRVSHAASSLMAPMLPSPMLKARFRRLVSSSTLALNSSSVNSARPAYLSGRCNGMAYAESVVQVPCRSGSPQGVRGVCHVPSFDALAILAASGP